ncbi:unnamed protein product, partial [Mesorhabditis belari]|uniref:FHA domain-containing protein n=1 Tax=Mesorhabditis belari TaxID=2138241 RepID=A0AAF3J4N4_9BILA
MYKIKEQDGQKRIHTINSGSLKIGRDPAQCKINLPIAAAGVSRVHAILELRGDDLVLVDQSAYGTLIDDEVVLKGSRVLKHKDEFTVGVFTFVVEGAPPKEPSQQTRKSTSKGKITNFFQAPTQRVSQFNFGNTLAEETQRSITQKSSTSTQNLRSKLLGGKTVDPNDSDDEFMIINETPRRSQRSQQSMTPLKETPNSSRKCSTTNPYGTLSSFVNDDDDDIMAPAVSSRTTQRSVKTIGNVQSRAQMRAANLRKKHESENSNTLCAGGSNDFSSLHPSKKAKMVMETKFTGEDAVAVPLDSGPVVSTSQAPTHSVRNLDEAFQAVSPKKTELGHPRRKSPPAKRSRLEKETIEDNEFVCPEPQKEIKRKAPKKVDIKAVEKEFENLCAQMCSGKSTEEDDVSGPQQQIQKIEERERKEASLIHEKMDLMISYTNLERPSQMLSFASNSTASSSGGLPNCKKFRKAQQGRFNESIYKEKGQPQ